MSKVFLITFGAAVVVIVGLIWLGFAKTEGNHLAPTGAIGKVRIVKSSDESTFMVVDFNVKNDSDVAMTVHSIETNVDFPDGSSAPGSAASGSDMPMAFKNYPLLGEQYNPVLKDRDVIPAHQQVDRMVGVTIDLPFERVEKRSDVRIRIEDATGPAVEMKK